MWVVAVLIFGVLFTGPQTKSEESCKAFAEMLQQVGATAVCTEVPRDS